MESGLLNLKAELLKNKSQVKFSNEAAPLFKKSRTSLVKKTECSNKKLDSKEKSLPLLDEEEKKLEKSRSVLEQKALLYDKLQSGEANIDNEKIKRSFLVDFKKGLTEKEYICARNEIQVQKWNHIQEESGCKDELHYQDVLFDEARHHGVAFMPFSRDEAERKAQHHLLRDLRTETKTATANRAQDEKLKKKLLQERLKKVRNKKRLKLGLPIKDDDLKTPPLSDDDELDVSTIPIPPIPENPKVPNSEDLKKKNIREWDLGKPGVMDIMSQDKSVTREIMSQEEWIETRREVRDNEFAPPSLYNQPANQRPNNQPANQRPNNQPANQRHNNQPANQRHNNQPANQRPNNQPANQRPNNQPTNQGKKKKKKKKKKKNLYNETLLDSSSSNSNQQNSFGSGSSINYDLQNSFIRGSSNNYDQSNSFGGSSSNSFANQSSFGSGSYSKSKQQYSFGGGSCSNYDNQRAFGEGSRINDTQANSFAGSSQSNKNFEFAPPPTYEYYGRNKKFNQSSGPTNISLEEAITKGLRNFRDQNNL